MNEEQTNFKEFLEELPSVANDSELITALMVVVSELGERLLNTNQQSTICVATTAAYLAKTCEIRLAGYMDVEMASLSAKTTMVDKFERQVNADTA